MVQGTYGRGGPEQATTVWLGGRGETISEQSALGPESQGPPLPGVCTSLLLRRAASGDTLSQATTSHLDPWSPSSPSCANLMPSRLPSRTPVLRKKHKGWAEPARSMPGQTTSQGPTLCSHSSVPAPELPLPGPGHLACAHHSTEHTKLSRPPRGLQGRGCSSLVMLHAWQRPAVSRTLRKCPLRYTRTPAALVVGTWVCWLKDKTPFCLAPLWSLETPGVHAPFPVLLLLSLQPWGG